MRWLDRLLGRDLPDVSAPPRVAMPPEEMAALLREEQDRRAEQRRRQDEARLRRLRVEAELRRRAPGTD